MKRKVFSYLTLFILCLLATSCSSDDEPGKDPGSESSPKVEILGGTEASSIVFHQDGGEKSIKFKTSESWTVKVDGVDSSHEWLTVSPKTGSSGESAIILKAAQNEQKEERKCMVSIVTPHAKATIDVKQMQKDALVIAKSSYTVDEKGGDIEIEVGHNVDFDVSIDVDWIKQTSSRSYQTEKLVFKVAENPDYDNREGKITFTSKDGTIKQEVKVYQTTGNTLVVSPTQNSFDCNEHTFDIEIKANVEFIVTDPDADWLHRVEGRALTSHTLHYKIDANDGVENREAKIQVKSKDGSMSETVSVLQMQKDALVVAQSEYSLSEKGGKIEVKVGHNVDFDVSIDVDWIARKENNGRAFVTDKLVFEVSENTNHDNRDGKITFTSSDKKIKQEVKVYQKFSTLKIAFLDDYIEGTETFLFENGAIVNLARDTVADYRISLNSLDLSTGEWKNETAVAIYCDSVLTPLFIIDNDYIFQLFPQNNKKYDINVYTKSGGLVECHNDIEVPQFNAKTDKTRGSTEGLTAKDEIASILLLYQFLHDIYNTTTPIALAGSIASLLNATLDDGISKSLNDFIFSTAGLLMNARLGALGFILSYDSLINSICEKWVEKLIGDVTPYIQKVALISPNRANVHSIISGVSNYTDNVPMYRINYWYEVNGSKSNITSTTEPQRAINGENIVTINNLKGGTLGFQIIVFPHIFENHILQKMYCFRSNVMKLTIPPLYFSELIQKDASFQEDGTVLVTVNSKLASTSETDGALLNYYQDYGVCVKSDVHITKQEKFFSAKEQGSMNLIMYFKYPKEDFIINYKSLEATRANKIGFSIYTTAVNGIQNMYDYQEYQFVYDQKPQAFTGDVSSVTQSSATVECSYADFQFWDGVCGVEYSGDGNTNTIICGLKEDGDYIYDIDGLKDGETYTYRAFISCKGNNIYGETKQFTTEKKDDGPTSVQWIDLGLPSGVKWASHNVGATSPEGYGDYFAWGETSTKAAYEISNYKYAHVSDNGHFVGEDGKVYKFLHISAFSGNPQYDAATANWGGGARMPTLVECRELVKYCTLEWTTHNGVNGRLVTGPNGNRIFLPAAGYRGGTLLINVGDYGYYWSSAPDEDHDYYACGFYLNSGNLDWIDNWLRYGGHTVRPVRN